MILKVFGVLFNFFSASNDYHSLFEISSQVYYQISREIMKILFLKINLQCKIFYSGLIIIITSSGHRKKISNQRKKDAISNIPQRKKKESNLLQNNEMF